MKRFEYKITKHSADTFDKIIYFFQKGEKRRRIRVYPEIQDQSLGQSRSVFSTVLKRLQNLRQAQREIATKRKRSP